jgi:hypothetical protein
MSKKIILRKGYSVVPHAPPSKYQVKRASVFEKAYQKRTMREATKFQNLRRRSKLRKIRK